MYQAVNKVLINENKRQGRFDTMKARSHTYSASTKFFRCSHRCQVQWLQTGLCLWCYQSQTIVPCTLSKSSIQLQNNIAHLHHCTTIISSGTPFTKCNKNLLLTFLLFNSLYHYNKGPITVMVRSNLFQSAFAKKWLSQDLDCIYTHVLLYRPFSIRQF